MKTTILKAAFTVLALAGLSSCNFTEEMYINEDGTGKYSVVMDGAQMMGMAAGEMAKDPDASKVIDTTVTFKEAFAAKKDSIAKLPKDQQERLKRLEGFSMHMKMNAAEQQMLMEMGTNFKNVGELDDALTSMNSLMMMGKELEATPLGKTGGFGNNNSKLNFTYNGKKFSRKATLLKKPDASVANDSMAEAMNMIYEASTYTVKYHFPKKVKKVSLSSAVISEDKKMVTIEFPFNDYMKEPAKLDFDVEFEK